MVVEALLHDQLMHGVGVAALGALMLSAGLHKLRDAHALARVLDGYAVALGALMPVALRRVLVRLLPLLELLAGFAMLASYWLPLAAWPCVLLLGGYAGVLATSVLRGVAIEDCGCHFGASRQAPSRALVWRNLLLMLLAWHLTQPIYHRPLAWFDAITFGFGLLAVAALYLAANLLVANRNSLREL